MLTMLSALGILVMSASSLPKTLRVVMIASLAGCACDLKLHGVLFLLPALFVLLGQVKRRKLPLAGALAGATFLVTALLPFSANARNIGQVFQSVHNYYVYLHLASGRGLDPGILINNLFVVASLAGTLLLLSRSASMLSSEIKQLSWIHAALHRWIQVSAQS